MERTDRDVLRSLVPETPLTWVAIVLVVGNLLDALFTFTLLQRRVVHETNPLMRWVYEGSPRRAAFRPALLTPRRQPGV